MSTKRTPQPFPIRTTLFAALIGLSGLVGVGNSFATSSLSLAEKNINQTINVRLGSPVSLSLNSMYWNLTPLKAGASLKQKGTVIQKPILPGPSAPAGCGVPGSGCGVQTWKFSTIKLGVTHLLATRTTCGEALRCTGTNGSFRVTVKVIK